MVVGSGGAATSLPPYGPGVELASHARIAGSVWLAASPLVLGYGGAMAAWHFVLGGLLVVLSLLELWQDWKLSDRDLAKHGQ